MMPAFMTRASCLLDAADESQAAFIMFANANSTDVDMINTPSKWYIWPQLTRSIVVVVQNHLSVSKMCRKKSQKLEEAPCTL